MVDFGAHAGRSEVAWGIAANHGGGYQYRLCPADKDPTEEGQMTMGHGFVMLNCQLLGTHHGVSENHMEQRHKTTIIRS